MQNPCVCFLPIFIMYQTFFVKVWFKLLKYDLYKRIIVITKFSNQSHTHNLYRWPLLHVIASYSTVLYSGDEGQVAPHLSCTVETVPNIGVIHICIKSVVAYTQWIQNTVPQKLMMVLYGGHVQYPMKINDDIIILL